MGQEVPQWLLPAGGVLRGQPRRAVRLLAGRSPQPRWLSYMHEFVPSIQRFSCLAPRHNGGHLLIPGLHFAGCRTVSETYTETEFEIQPDKASATIAPSITWRLCPS